MNAFFYAIILLTFLSARYCKKGEFNRETYASFEQSRLVEGLFTLLVVLTHFRNEFAMNTVNDKAYFAFQSHIKQCVVAMFLFYSGYGVMNNIMEKGREYGIKKLPQRFVRLFLQYAIAVCIFIAYRAVTGRTYSFRTYALTFLGWESIGNSNWFIFCSLWLYIFAFISYLIANGILRKKGKDEWMHIAFLILFTAMSVGYVKVMKMAGKGYWWYDTALVFAFGAWYRYGKSIIDKIVMRSDTSYYVSFSLVVMVYVLSYLGKDQSFFLYQAWVMCFVLINVLLTMKISLGSSLLAFAGSHVFSIYMLQRIPLMILETTGLVKTHPYFGLCITFASTFLIAIPFDMLLKRILPFGKPRLTDKAIVR